MSTCVSCLGKWRKQTFQSWDPGLRLQSKLWKQNLRALNHGPHPVRKSGIPPAYRPSTGALQSRPPAAECGGSSILANVDTWAAWPRVSQLRKVSALSVLADKTVQSLCVRCSWDLLCAAVPRPIPPSEFVNAPCLWNIFFSYLRDKWDLHFPLNKSDYASFYFFFQISDIWSNSNLFSYLTFSNNWAEALAELVAVVSKSLPCDSVFLGTGEDYAVSLESLSWWIVFRYTWKLLYGGFWVDSIKG